MWSVQDDGWVPEEEPDTKVHALPGGFKNTDLGNAERLVAKYRDRVRFSHQRKRWLLWNDRYWQWDETAAIERMAKRTVRSVYAEALDAPEKRAQALREWAHKSEDRKRIMAMAALASSEEGVPVLMADLDADPYLLNCQNGTVNLRDGELREHRRLDLITRCTHVSYKPQAQSELWDRVLKEACGGDIELAQYIQHVAGYALIGLPLERVFFFLHGEPGTAKSTLIDALHAAFGGYVEEADFDTWLLKNQPGGNRGDLVRLAGARLVTSREAKPGAKWDETLIKRITGGDPLTVAAKYENEITFHPACALVFAANDAPSAREDDDGFWARMRRIPLTHQIPVERQDRTLKQRLKLPEHAEAILAWAVAGAVSYLNRGMPTCGVVEHSSKEYRQELDHFSRFLEDRTERGDGYFVSRRDLRKSYASWAEEVGRKSLLDDRAIVRKLRSRGFEELPPRHGYAMWGGLQLRAMGSQSEPDESRWG